MQDGIEEIKEHPFFEGIEWDQILKKTFPVPYKPKVSNDADVSQIDEEFLVMEDPSQQGIPKMISYESNPVSELELIHREEFEIENFTFVNMRKIDQIVNRQKKQEVLTPRSKKISLHNFSDACSEPPTPQKKPIMDVIEEEGGDQQGQNYHN